MKRRTDGTVPGHTVMIPSQVRQPFHREGWIYEEKIDGWRMLTYKDGRNARLESRTGVDHPRRFPDLAERAGGLGGGFRARVRGYVAKDAGSPYRGGVTRSWLSFQSARMDRSGGPMAPPQISSRLGVCTRPRGRRLERAGPLSCAISIEIMV